MKLLYFAWLRERLNRGEQDITPPAEAANVADLIDWMAANDEAFALAFEKRSLIKVAVDAEIVDHDALIADAETIAFFPPMTGG